MLGSTEKYNYEGRKLMPFYGDQIVQMFRMFSFAVQYSFLVLRLIPSLFDFIYMFFKQCVSTKRHNYLMLFFRGI